MYFLLFVLSFFAQIVTRKGMKRRKRGFSGVSASEFKTVKQEAAHSLNSRRL